MRRSREHGHARRAAGCERGRSRFRRDRRGVGGFFEEIPAFIVVVISLAVFITTAYTSYNSYMRNQELGSLQDDCYRLCRAFRSYEPILERGLISQEPQTGHFYSDGLDRLTLEALKMNLSSPHPFSINITDRATGKSWVLGEKAPPGAPFKAGITSAVLIVGPDRGRNPGTLEVMMWE
jgi:hypothetical protein